MTFVATLITQASELTPAFVARAAAVLPAAGAMLWLDPGVAVDIPFAPPPGSGNPRWAEAARETFAGSPVDVVVQVAAHRRKRLLVADMDSTIIDQECIDELADVVGRRAEVSAITERSMRGEVSFDASLRERVALLAGLDVAAAARVIDRITLKRGAEVLVRTMRRHGALTALASGGFTIFTAHVASAAGFDHHYGNVLAIERGRLTGALQEPIFGRASKRAVLRTLRDDHRLAPEDTLAVGDGANDLAMLEEAGLGVAFHAKPAVAAVARAKIEHADLTALLYMQGYSRAEFAA